MGIHEGREFLEQPLWVKIGIVVGALIFLYNISLTVLRGRRTAITNVLLLGMMGIAVFCLFAFYNPSNIAVDKLYWWYIVHLWVEGVWELVMASDPRLPGHQDDRRRPRGGGEVALRHRRPGAVLRPARHRPPLLLDRRSGLLAVDRHRSSRRSRSRPFFAMVVFAFTMAWKGRRDHPNKAAFLWTLGSTGDRLLRRRRMGLHAHAVAASTTTATAPRSPRRTATSPSSAPT